MALRHLLFPPPPSIPSATLRDTRRRPTTKVWRHGLSLFGDLKYPAGFKHFDYVNPNAPKGGIVRLGAFGTFDNFNIVIRGVKGTIVAGIDLIYETLMTPALDEVSTEYGLLAEAVSHPADFASVTYRLRAEAQWHDGKPVTVEDVIFSFEALKKHHPQYSAYYRHVTKAEKTGEREITFTFDDPGNRELPQIVGQFNVLPKHWWEGTDSSGKQARHHRHDARAAARQRRLPDQGVRCRPQHRVRARQGLLGQGPQREHRARQFRRAALRVFPRLHRRARGLQGRRGRLAHREQREELGDRLRLPRRSRRSACCWRNSRSAPAA